MSFRRILLIAAFAGVPSIASAQFTTFIPPKNVVADSAKAVVVAQQKLQADSISHAQITDMRTWVDSAAGVAPAPTTVSDSVASSVSGTAAETTSFQNGTRAPMTASSLPLVALIGAAALLLGTFLLGGGARTHEGA
ncbi:MAG TPA: hypothetical protein VH277_09820 [Gemmatimonadaceae bacterium]|jgi:hypothetical protein|nr:hypothetical protein [Gemmatimonadaceae bacterium]